MNYVPPALPVFANPSVLLFPQEVIEEREDLGVRLRRGRVALAHGHADAVLVPEEFVERDRLVQRRPALGAILGPAGNQERARRHQGVQLVHIVTFGDQRLVRAGPRTALLDRAFLALLLRGLVE